MYVAMNRFRIARGHEHIFEELWRSRDSHLDQVEGFREFHLLQGATDDNSTLYVSHTLWDSLDAFEAWRDSDHFHKAHAQARTPQGVYLKPPRFEGFEVVL
jgi:heme-degrading monooxygenase HmoA